MNESKVLSGLNPEQKRSASIIDGIVCTNAGPGSGKTRTLVHSIAYRIEQGVAAEEIAAITFTNKAKEEIKDRLISLLGVKQARSINVGTYHGFFSANVLMPNRKHDLIKAIGYQDGFVIAEKDDSDKILEEAIKEMPGAMRVLYEAAELKSRDIKSYMSTHRANGYFAQNYLNQFGKVNKEAVISFSKIKPNLLILAKSPGSEYDQEVVGEALDKCPAILDLCKMSAWRSYENRMIRLNALDYDGMMVVAKYLLENSSDIRRKVAESIKHILLDEFQDTNNVQWDAMKLIIDEMASKNLFLVGDPDQCIYQFRNANPQIMREFSSIYPETHMMYLTVNYRSTPENVALCNAIKGFIDPSNLDHPMTANSSSSIMPRYQFFNDEKEEAAFVVANIKERLLHGILPNQIAALYRGKAQKRSLEMALTESQLGYHIVGDTSFYETKEVKDAIAMLRMISTEVDILGFARGLTASSVSVNGITMRMALEKAKEENKPITPMQYLYERFTPKGKASDAAKAKMAFWISLRELMVKEKSISTDEYICRWLIQGFNEASSPLGQTLSREEMLKLYADSKAQGLLHPLFEEDMNRERNDFHEAVINNLKSFYNEYYYEKLVKYSEQTDQKSGEHDAARLIERKDNVDQLFTTLLSKLNETGSFEDSVNELIMLTEQDITETNDHIQLMTIHASKGLEFDTVFIIGAEQRSFFGQRDLADDAYQNEACAFFVAASRAENVNIITGAKGRTINGQFDTNTEELIFVRNLPLHLIEKESMHARNESSNSYSYQSEINNYKAPVSPAEPLPKSQSGQIDVGALMRRMGP